MNVRIHAPAKVNLHLEVGAPGPDGYHPVETVLQALAFGDTVTVVGDTAPSFSCIPDLGIPAEENLAWRAARAMAEGLGHVLDAAIAVQKRVPAGAGLGGASSDAAAVIVGLAALWGIGLADERLAGIARSLGADVPFFLEGGTAHYTARGDVLVSRLRPLDAHVVLVKPAASVPTGQAYAAFDGFGVPASTSIEPLLGSIEAGDVGAVAAHLHNAMTAASTGLVPTIASALALVSATPGVLGAAMAGSGSAVFGICTDAAHAESSAAAARESGFWAEATRMRPAGCVIEPA